MNDGEQDEQYGPSPNKVSRPNNGITPENGGNGAPPNSPTLSPSAPAPNVLQAPIPPPPAPFFPPQNGQNHLNNGGPVGPHGLLPPPIPPPGLFIPLQIPPQHHQNGAPAPNNVGAGNGPQMQVLTIDEILSSSQIKIAELLQLKSKGTIEETLVAILVAVSPESPPHPLVRGQRRRIILVDNTQMISAYVYIKPWVYEVGDVLAVRRFSISSCRLTLHTKTLIGS